MYTNRQFIQIAIIVIIILIILTITNFIIKLTKFKNSIDQIDNNQLFYNLNPSEKVIAKYKTKLFKYRSVIKEVISTNSTLGLGVNFGFKVGKQISHKQFKGLIGQAEEQINGVSLILTNQRIILTSMEYNLSIRHLNILGLVFDDKNLYLIQNQKSMLKILFKASNEFNHFKTKCIEDTYLKKRLQIIDINEEENI